MLGSNRSCLYSKVVFVIEEERTYRVPVDIGSLELTYNPVTCSVLVMLYAGSGQYVRVSAEFMDEVCSTWAALKAKVGI